MKVGWTSVLVLLLTGAGAGAGHAWGVEPEGFGDLVAPTGAAPRFRNDVSEDRERAREIFAEAARPDPEHFWFRAEQLLWWLKKGPEPVPLATTGPAPPGGTIPGFLGQPGTRTLLGDQSLLQGMRPGGRFTAGYWLNPEKTLGVEADYLLLIERTASETIGTSGRTGSPNIAIPYFDVTGAAIRPNFHPQNHVPGESIWALPGPLGGFKGLTTLSGSSRLQGSEINTLIPIRATETLQVSATAGFRWLQLVEDLTFAVQTQGVTAASAGSFFNSQDRFLMQNNFFGGQFGAKVEYRKGAWTFRSKTELALGVMHENADVTGLARTSAGTINYPTMNTGGALLPGGIFAQRTNGGSHSSDRFAVVPEKTFTLIYHVTDALRLSIGYSLIAASAVARPGDQIDRRINSTLTGLAEASRASGKSHVPPQGPAQPNFPFHQSSFWAQGINLSLEYQF